MNKMEIAIARLKKMEGYNEAVKAIHNPLEGFGVKFTNNEKSALLEIAKLWFK